jgi:FtsZ-binding cell division protein ZapB
VELEKFENLEKRVKRLVEQFSLLKREKDKIAGVLKKNSVEDRETKKRLEKLHREKYLIRSKLDALIDKLESIEHMG